MHSKNNIDPSILYVIYDDECPLCRNYQVGLNIQKNVGKLELINAREDHPIVKHLYDLGHSPENSVIVIYQQQYYFAGDAMHLLNLLNTPVGLFNKLFALLLRYPVLSRVIYPVIKTLRGISIRVKGVGAINQDSGKPIFMQALGEDWLKLPPVLQRRLSNRPYSNDELKIEGVMQVHSSRYMNFILPMLRIGGAAFPPPQENIPVTVIFRSDKNSARFWFDREFHFQPPHKFKSYMALVKENVIADYMHFNLGWRAKISVADNRLKFTHAGYIIRIFNFHIPLPLALLIGQCHAEEQALSENSFKMKMTMDHFLLGRIYEYSGEFCLAGA